MSTLGNNRNNVTLTLKLGKFEKITVTLTVTVTVITVTRFEVEWGDAFQRIACYQDFGLAAGKFFRDVRGAFEKAVSVAFEAGAGEFDEVSEQSVVGGEVPPSSVRSIRSSLQRRAVGRQSSRRLLMLLCFASIPGARGQVGWGERGRRGRFSLPFWR